jgi:phenylacetate-CoA ligase
VVFLWGSEGEILKGRVALKSQLIRRLANETSINAFQIGEREVALFLSALERRSPKLIVAYAQSLYEVARLVSERSLRVRPPLAIITSAGTLYEFMRREIEQAFGCRVRNQYGSREIGPAALECEAGTGLHIAPWAVHAEVVGPNDESLEVGEEGELLVTSLTNYAMPLLRYAVGDRAALSRTAFCVCGHTGATLTRIAGRIVDSFLTRRGTIVDGEYFTHLLYHCDWVRQFQVVQRDHLDVVFRIVRTPGRAAPEAELDRIAAGTRAALGEECGVDFEFPDEVPPGPSGKFRFTISDVPRDAGRSKYGFES